MKENLLADLVLGPLSRYSGRSKFSVAAGSVLSHASSMLCRLWDPLVSYEIDGTRLLMPLSHKLPYYRAKHPGHGENIARIAGYVEEKYPGCGIVDIGANVGDTAAFLRNQVNSPILCIEGHPFYFSLLRHNTAHLRDVIAYRAIVGAAGSSQMGIKMIGGTGAVDSKAGVVGEAQPLETILRGNPGFLNSKLLKIDTDGFDHRILDSSLGWLSARRPVIFWEFDLEAEQKVGGPVIRIIDKLVDAGYRTALIFDNYGSYVCGLSDLSAGTLEEMGGYCLIENRRIYYLDVCCFHSEDDDLYRSSRRREEARRAGLNPRISSARTAEI